MRGKIKKLSEKGFGFITIDGRKKDLFFHSSKLNGVRFMELTEGDEVEIDEVEATERGDQACGVSLVG